MNFEDLNLNTPLRNALNDLGYIHPTSIQSKVFPIVMAGHDVIGIAQTGTGKTIAYLLPLLRMWTFSKDIHPQILILVPTRELVVQLEVELKKITTYISIRVCGVYGGTNIRNQAFSLQQGVDIIIGTPGRVLDLILNNHVKMKSIKRVVIDEVDEMLNLGFRAQINRVFDLLPIKRQNLMFSATMTEEVEKLIHTYFSNTKKVEAAPSGTPLEKIHQSAYYVPNFNTKLNLVTYFLNQDKFNKTLLFTKTKALADQIFDALKLRFEDRVGVIHSNKEQNYRFRSVNNFKSGEIHTLIATDIIARGIDIKDVSHVINFDIPETLEEYIHRIGRTGRADKEGRAISLITELDRENFELIDNNLTKKIEIDELPEEIIISDILTEDELPKINTKEIKLKITKIDSSTSAFHEKSAKNSKVNHRVSRREKMMTKYGKYQTRGQKKK
ncbi:MAG: DEAD/DEAH box helicase [Saprospiraceae bacterium]